MYDTNLNRIRLVRQIRHSQVDSITASEPITQSMHQPQSNREAAEQLEHLFALAGFRSYLLTIR